MLFRSNLGEGKGYTIKETAEMIKEAVGWDGEYAFDTSRLDGAPTKVLDVRRMKEALGWQQKTPIREGIRKTVKWYMKNMVQSRGGKT